MQIACDLSPQSRSARQLPLSPRGALGAAVQTAFSNYHTLHERPLRGTDAQCAPLRYKSRDRAKKLLCAASIPCSGAVGAALGKSSEAVMAIRFHWPARSREGAGSTGRDSPMERNGLGIASSGDARRGPQGGPGAAAPGAFWGLFRGEKSPAGGKQAHDARALPSNRPACGGFGPMKASALAGAPLSHAVGMTAPLKGSLWLVHSAEAL